LSLKWDILKDRRGNMFPYVVAIILVLLMLVSGVFQALKTYAYADKAKSIVQDALMASCTANYEGVYYGMREGNTGAYAPDSSGNIHSTADTGEVGNYLLSEYGLKNINSSFEKTDDGGNELFTIKNLIVSVKNPSDNSAVFQESASFTLSVPFFFAGDILPHISITLHVKSGYVEKF
jgi:hypothetical protein